MRSLLNKIGFNVSTSYIYGDNPSSIQEKHSKHIDIYYYYIRDLIENEQIKLYHIDKKENPAGILTKNLGQIIFSHFYSSLGLEIL